MSLYSNRSDLLCTSLPPCWDSIFCWSRLIFSSLQFNFKMANSIMRDWILTHPLTMWPWLINLLFFDLNSITYKIINIVLAAAKTNSTLWKFQLIPCFFFSWNLPHIYVRSSWHWGIVTLSSFYGDACSYRKIKILESLF